MSDDAQIADRFARGFNEIYLSTDSSRSSELLDEFHMLYNNYSSEHLNDSIDHLYLTWNEMLTVLFKLKTGKSSASFIRAEHILYGSPKLAWHLHLLFNAMIQHSYDSVPTKPTFRVSKWVKIENIHE